MAYKFLCTCESAFPLPPQPHRACLCALLLMLIDDGLRNGHVVAIARLQAVGARYGNYSRLFAAAGAGVLHKVPVLGRNLLKSAQGQARGAPQSGLQGSKHE
ncbi:hypothetical protein DCS_01051 [Drechmeria coniospora]|uniref:Uncharacterized protein n=1 Tax=Drechmeria coniospora TaxID=98403 RepID=A0A151GS32_DRECN|nr:hypothetical protein DCS_01051 [Drechmeria coniospora]KYK59917.1 hypothetical protein DCS_01051 [Drechmeria coniospora]